MKLIEKAILLIGLLPLGVFAQPTPPAPSGPPPGMPPRAMPGGMPSRMMSGGPQMPPAVMPDKEKVSYAIGMNIGKNIQKSDIQVNVDTLASAIKDVIAGKTNVMTEKEYTETLSQLNRAMSAKRQAEMEENKAKGDKFLADNAKLPGVTALPSGVQYKVLKDGTGPIAKDNDVVNVAYRGTLMDGTEFDANNSFSTPIRGRIIRGWQEVLPLMKQGSKWKIFIPANMGYGPRGMPPKIGPNAVLVFDIELNSITPGATTPPPAAPTSFPSPGAASHNSTTPVVSGEIIKVPSADELKHGAKIEVIKPGQTNSAATQ